MPFRQQREPEPGERVLEWYEMHRAQLLRYARRVLGSLEGAEDVVQDVFYRLLRQDDLHGLRNPRAFLMTAARHAAIDRLRKQRPQVDITVAEESLSPGEAALDGAETITAMGRALDALPERCRQAFVLRRFKGLDTSEVAQLLGISPRMVQKHITAALRHFEEHLGSGPGR